MVGKSVPFLCKGCRGLLLGFQGEVWLAHQTDGLFRNRKYSVCLISINESHYDTFSYLLRFLFHSYPFCFYISTSLKNKKDTIKEHNNIWRPKRRKGWLWKERRGGQNSLDHGPLAEFTSLEGELGGGQKGVSTEVPTTSHAPPLSYGGDGGIALDPGNGNAGRILRKQSIHDHGGPGWCRAGNHIMYEVVERPAYILPGEELTCGETWKCVSWKKN